MLLYLLLSLISLGASGIVKRNSAALWSLSEELDKTELTKPPELKFVSDSMVDQTIEAGSELELRCEVAGIPTPIIMWTLNGKTIEGHYESTVYEKLHNVARPTIQNGITVSRIRIPCVDRTHRGRYKCIATTGKQTIEKIARITVVGSSPCEKVNQPPFIQLWSDGRFENEGNSVQLLCRSQKNAVIAWYNEDRELLNNLEGYEVFPNGDLLIKNAQWEHMGTYTCVASNDVGEDRVTTFFYPTAISEEDAKKFQQLQQQQQSL